MKNKYIWLISVPVCLWLVVLIVVISYAFCKNNNDMEFSFANVVFVAAGALFTGLAFSGTIYAILLQDKNRIWTTTLNVYLDVIQKIRGDRLFNESLEYIMNKFDTDYKTLGDTITSMHKLLEYKTEYPQEFKNITTFCSMMEYVGVIVANDYMDTKVLFDYWKEIIVDSYKKIYQLFETDMKNKKDPYPHYTILYQQAKKYNRAD
jgi:hypothetical protein